MNAAQARSNIWDAMAATLENDIDGNGADYIYRLGSEFDVRRTVKAARQVAATMRKNAKRARGDKP
jgi:hypothetical protein